MCSGDGWPLVLEIGVPATESAEPCWAATCAVLESRAEPNATAAMKIAEPAASTSLTRPPRIIRLASPDPDVDGEAHSPHGARPRALPDDAAAQGSPGANATHRADPAAGAADPALRDSDLHSDQPWHAAASRRRRRRRRRGR